MKKIFLLGLVAISLSSCTDEKNAQRVLEENGYTNIVLTGYKCFKCSDSDNFSTGFMADSPTGKHVEGTVCSGFMKGSTIRFD